ncbi:MAG TPA: GGDEF domain-containing protein [Thermoanaerobaculia bacterium]|nr:GGDEF domain-containing protein [Thermoanaerobaculia bacterium]
MSAIRRRVFCVLLVLALRAGAAERGFPLITVFPSEVHKAGPQTFDVAQDARGVLLFGNLHGLVTYDGAWWDLHTLPDDQAPLSIETDPQGRVALGLVNDFGHLARDANGSYEYHSLGKTLPAAEREVGDIREVCVTPAGFLYVAERSLIVWNGGNAKTVARFPAETAPRGCYSDAQGVFLRGPQGLQRLDPATFTIAPAGVTSRVVHVMRHANGSLVAVTRDGGLFLVDGGQATPFAPAVVAWLKEKSVTGGERLRDGRMVLLTRHHGLVVFDRDGRIEQALGAGAGLPDAVHRKAFVDREGSLWVAMEGPIARIDLASPVTVFDERMGVRGSAGDVIHFGDRLFAGTSHGVFELDGRGQAARLEPMQESAWRLIAVDGELLAGTSKGIYKVTPGAPLQHIVSIERELYDMHRSTADPSRIWIAHGDGVGSIRRVDGKWINEGLLPGIDHETASIVERDGVLWCGTVFHGVVQITDPRGPRQSVRQFGDGEMNVFAVDGRVVFVRASGQVTQIGPGGKLVPDARLGHLTAPRGFFVIAQDRRGDIWVNSTPPRVFERNADGSYAREGRPLVSVMASDIQNIRVTADGGIWFAADKGLFRFDPSATSAVFASQPRPLIRRVVAGEDRLLFGGVTAQRDKVELRHDFGRIRIEFAPASYRPGVEYQYRLDPIDTTWSKWTSGQFIDYTTLAANDYTFRLRARGAGSEPSPEAQWSFTVLAPWYLKRLAMGLWILLGLVVVLLLIRARTGSLQRQAEMLRARVAEQTAELQEAVTQLEALSHEDDLTGIANRRLFERRMAEEWNRARRHEQPLALILLDLDHFKELNDRRGHPAGDDCLRRVGSFLSETIRRSGEVVARYGGEEFTILLPATDSDGAIRVAETLRDGIERLLIPYGNGKRMTASCGVAALIPAADASPEHLVASADRALYAAKHSGRNCVRLADESTTGTWLRDASA